MDGMMETLRRLGEASDEDEKLASLDAILQVLVDQDNDLEKNAKLLLDGAITKALLPLLAPPGECAGKAAQVVAEITKTEEARGPCIEAGLVSPLLKLLKDDHRVQCQIQAARALGNICYENDRRTEYWTDDCTPLHGSAAPDCAAS
ncbi:Rap1 GTPase-GDP dissociation stimulator 1 [Lamellibrachia satsuma]|nr:Rap1 GTPase-GDP dissociation stimulator 1 [Lamellibrachia satsuma]